MRPVRLSLGFVLRLISQGYVPKSPGKGLAPRPSVERPWRGTCTYGLILLRAQFVYHEYLLNCTRGGFETSHPPLHLNRQLGKPGLREQGTRDTMTNGNSEPRCYRVRADELI